MASVLDLYGITIVTDPNSGVKTIAGWTPSTSLLLTWDDGAGGITNQNITDQTQAIRILQTASARKTPLTLLNASLEGAS